MTAANSGSSRSPLRPTTPQQQRTFTPRRPEGPRKVRGGIRLTGVLNERPDDTGERTASTGLSLAKQFLAIIDANIDPALLSAGVEYAKNGQIVSIDFFEGEIKGTVQGSAARPYQTAFAVPRFTDAQWERVIEVLSDEAVHVAKLLAGEMPPGVDERLSSIGLSLLPMSEEVTFACTCGASEKSRVKSAGGSRSSCKHAAALAALSAEKLAEQPLLIFTLRGRSSQQLVEQLGQARMMHAAPAGGKTDEPAIPELQTPALPLEACIEDFWRGPFGGRSEELIDERPPLQHVPHALLRRLGPSPMSGRFPMVGLLASVYDTVAASINTMREGAGDEEEKI